MVRRGTGQREEVHLLYPGWLAQVSLEGDGRFFMNDEPVLQPEGPFLCIRGYSKKAAGSKNWT